MHIGEVAERVKLSHRTVRHYDDEGLLVPTRSPGGFRLFSEADVQRLLLIRQMKPLGFSLEEMRAVIDALEAVGDGTVSDEQREALVAFAVESRRRRDKLDEQRRGADELIATVESVV